MRGRCQRQERFRVQFRLLAGGTSVPERRLVHHMWYRHSKQAAVYVERSQLFNFNLFHFRKIPFLGREKIRRCEEINCEVSTGDSLAKCYASRNRRSHRWTCFGSARHSFTPREPKTSQKKGPVIIAISVHLFK